MNISTDTRVLAVCIRMVVCISVYVSGIMCTRQEGIVVRV